MIIKYEVVDEQIIINVPDSEYWELRTRTWDSKGCEDYGVYLILSDREIEIRDTAYWSQGRNIPDCEVGELYEDIVKEVAERLACNQLLHYVDINEIEDKLLAEKYVDLWVEKGYLELDENGCWY